MTLSLVVEDSSGLSLTGATSVAIAGNYAAGSGGDTCAVLATGGVDCWGGNGNGQLGNGTTGGVFDVPAAVTGITDATSVAVSPYDTCARLSSGHVDCWGYNALGNLGNGTTVNSNVPVAVTGITDATSVAVGQGYNTCALLATGGIDCWGNNLW